MASEIVVGGVHKPAFADWGCTDQGGGETDTNDDLPEALFGRGVLAWITGYYSNLI
jgi:hypothetical protein